MDEFDRKQALDILNSAPADFLAQRYAAIKAKAPEAIPVRGPDIGTVMVRGRIGGGGGAFNLGEASVTRATVRLESGEVGHSIVLGRDEQKARTVAHLDALRQQSPWAAKIDADIVAPALASIKAEKLRLAEETEATKVDFFTVARGED